jgi:hypothetical protein
MPAWWPHSMQWVSHRSAGVQQRADLAQRLDARRERVAVVLDDAVEGRLGRRSGAGPSSFRYLRGTVMWRSPVITLKPMWPCLPVWRRREDLTETYSKRPDYGEGKPQCDNTRWSAMDQGQGRWWHSTRKRAQDFSLQIGLGNDHSITFTIRDGQPNRTTHWVGSGECSFANQPKENLRSWAIAANGRSFRVPSDGPVADSSSDGGRVHMHTPASPGLCVTSPASRPPGALREAPKASPPARLAGGGIVKPCFSYCVTDVASLLPNNITSLT